MGRASRQGSRRSTRTGRSQGTGRSGRSRRSVRSKRNSQRGKKVMMQMGCHNKPNSSRKIFEG